MAGPYPGAQDADEARRRLGWLLQQGVTACIDLTEAGDPELEPYSTLWVEEATAVGVSVRYVRLAIPDFSIPSHEHMTNILNQIDRLLVDDEVVYLHCHGGVGRTGLTVACYLVRHGLSAEFALAKLDCLREGTPNAWKRSPETDEQIQFVHDWEKLDPARESTEN